MIAGMCASRAGEADEHQETAKGLTILKESALGQIGIRWGAAQQVIAGAIEQCIRLAAKTRDTDETIPVKTDGSQQTQEVEIANIQKGNWYANVDTSYPDTKSMKRAIFTSLIEMSTKSPAIAAVACIARGSGAIQREFVGIEGFEDSRCGSGLATAPRVELCSRRVQASHHRRKCRQQLFPDGTAGSSGSAARWANAAARLILKPWLNRYKSPLLPIDPVWDFHQQHIQTIQDWLASQDKFDEESKGQL